MNVVILGCGYTGRRAAQRMLRRGNQVVGTSRSPDRLQDLSGLEALGFDVISDSSLDFIPEDSFIVFSIPPVENIADTGAVWRTLAGRKPRRVIYLSTTGVYGETRDVDEHTMPTPRHEREQQRLAAEQAAQSGPWSCLVLRPAAIYGPGRGIHQSMAEGRFRLVGSGENFVSRIHVEDLAAHVEAALLSQVTGTWPVADEQPCTSREIAEYCSRMLGMPMPDSLPPDAVHHTRRADRRVDGSGIRRELNLALTYPTYKDGIPASMDADRPFS